MDDGGFKRQQITGFTKSADDTDRQVRKIRVRSELFARVDIGKMDFDKREPGGQKRVTNRYAGVGISRRIDNDELDLLRPRLLDAADDIAFGVGLKSLQFDTILLRHGSQVLVDRGKRIVTVNFGFSRA